MKKILTNLYSLESELRVNIKQLNNIIKQTKMLKVENLQVMPDLQGSTGNLKHFLDVIRTRIKEIVNQLDNIEGDIDAKISEGE